jgi:hypothetical protein
VKTAAKITVLLATLAAGLFLFSMEPPTHQTAPHSKSPRSGDAVVVPAPIAANRVLKDKNRLSTAQKLEYATQDHIDWARLRQAKNQAELIDAGILELPIDESSMLLREMGQKPLFHQLDIGEAIAVCGTAQVDLDSVTKPNGPGQIYSASSLSYLTHACSKLWESAPSRRLLKWYVREIRPSESELAEAEYRGTAPRPDGGEPKLLELWNTLDGDRPFQERYQSALFALASPEEVFEGVNWREFENSMSTDRQVTFAVLIAAKFGCEKRGACRPESAQLVVMCGALFAHLHCQIGSDLGAIARMSLTEREFQWWQAIRRRKQAPDPTTRMKPWMPVGESLER